MSQLSKYNRKIHEIFHASSMVPDRLIHLVPDELAAKVPTHTLFAYPKYENPQHGFVEISAQRFANALNRTSWYLESLLGSPRDFDSVCYIGANDLRYFLLMLGAIKVGYKMLFLSPRNSLEGHLHILMSAKCQILLHSRTAKVDHIVESRSLPTYVVPELEHLLNDSPVPIYPYHKSFAEACNDPGLVLHTTGTTGLPKAITWKVGTLSTYEAWRTIPHVNGFVPTTEVYQEASRVYTSMPLFHTSGLNAAITWALLLGVTMVYGAPHVIPNAEYADKMHQHARVDGSIGAPSLYEELSRHVESLKRMGKLKYVIASGAPISDAAGMAISQYTRVIPNLGSTETACLQRLAPAIEDWAYFYWHPTHSGIDMREWMDGLYELFLVRDPKLIRYQGVFSTFPHIEEWSMGDLYSRHPDPFKPFLYRYRGRKDDVIVLSNGEKVSPALMEAALQRSPRVQGAMIVGRGKFQPAALIDLGTALPNDKEQYYELIRELEPFIAEANIHAPAHGQLDKHHILFADPRRPIHYLGQGKIQRYQTMKLYENDIEELYEAAENSEIIPQDSELFELNWINFSSKTSIKMRLKDLFIRMSGIKNLQLDDNFFKVGIDSLQVLRIGKELNAQLRFADIESSSGNRLITSSIYSNPTLNELTDCLFDMTNMARRNENRQDEGQRVRRMQSLLDKYSASLPLAEARIAPKTDGWVVLLTGSTGSLGSYILDELQKDSNVKEIICLDRSSDVAQRHMQTGPPRGLSCIDDTRVKFLQADLARPNFGLAIEGYEALIISVTHVIHNQWPVNFNWPLKLFEPSIAGVRNLANFAATSLHDPFILFVSSVSSVGGSKDAGPYPEAPAPHLNLAAHMGYGESKLISEHLLGRAAAICNVRSATCRVGIVSGPIESRLGMWNKHEYIPSVIISSQVLGVFPNTFPGRDRIDWLPVDKVSKVLLEILHSASIEPCEELAQVFNVVNTQAGFWGSDIADAVISMYPSGDVRAVSMEDWVKKLRISAEEAERTGNYDNIEANPAIRLLDFFSTVSDSGAGQGPRWLSSSKAEKLSVTLRTLGPLRKLWLENWMVQWGIKSEDFIVMCVIVLPKSVEELFDGVNFKWESSGNLRFTFRDPGQGFNIM
ncbi:putative NRPS-like enzyme [Xylaria flabelliformis]|nr:putative NRPS-like enzyme [Xylaria flabelliformis]